MEAEEAKGTPGCSLSTVCVYAIQLNSVWFPRLPTDLKTQHFGECITKTEWTKSQFSCEGALSRNIGLDELLRLQFDFLRYLLSAFLHFMNTLFLPAYRRQLHRSNHTFCVLRILGIAGKTLFRSTCCGTSIFWKVLAVWSCVGARCLEFIFVFNSLIRIGIYWRFETNFGFNLWWFWWFVHFSSYWEASECWLTEYFARFD